MDLWLIILIAVVVFIILVIASSYNTLVRLRNGVRDGWSQVDVQLKRRFDLIPNLVETVKAYAAHEKSTLENVIKARNSFLQAGTKEKEMEANGELSQAIGKLFALAENYPDLKANANFVELQKELTETEDKISFARQFYNDTVFKLNNKVEMFPSNIIANMFGFKEEKFFEIADKEKENIAVKF